MVVVRRSKFKVSRKSKKKSSKLTRTAKNRKKINRVVESAVKRARRKASPKKKATLQVKKALPRAGQPNLLVTFEPTKVSSSRREIIDVLKMINEKGGIFETQVNGVFKVKVNDSRKVIRKLNELCNGNPEIFSRTYRWTPVDVWTDSSLENMQNIVSGISKGIKSNESWKLKIDKRNYEISEKELVSHLTEKINKDKVDLENPNKIIKVDIIGEEAGISLLVSDEILNVLKIKGKY